ncbi:Uncharacterised protein [uncultured archaeon]|nr:Uncharacterised protein [uncultured archaeon]
MFLALKAELHVSGSYKLDNHRERSGAFIDF